MTAVTLARSLIRRKGFCNPQHALFCLCKCDLAGLASIGPRYQPTRYCVVVKREVNQQTTFSKYLVVLNHALELAVFKPPGFRPNQIHQNHANGEKNFCHFTCCWPSQSCETIFSYKNELKWVSGAYLHDAGLRNLVRQSFLFKNELKWVSGAYLHDAGLRNLVRHLFFL